MQQSEVCVGGGRVSQSAVFGGNLKPPFSGLMVCVWACGQGAHTDAAYWGRQSGWAAHAYSESAANQASQRVTPKPQWPSNTSWETTPRCARLIFSLFDRSGSSPPILGDRVFDSGAPRLSSTQKFKNPSLKNNLSLNFVLFYVYVSLWNCQNVKCTDI